MALGRWSPLCHRYPSGGSSKDWQPLHRGWSLRRGWWLNGKGPVDFQKYNKICKDQGYLRRPQSPSQKLQVQWSKVKLFDQISFDRHQLWSKSCPWSGLAMALLCRGLALLCLLPLKCYSYRVVERDSRSLHGAKDEFIPQGTKQMFKGVARSVGRINQMSQMYRENLFRVHQRNLHLRNSAMKPNLMRDFHQMQRFQNLGRYRFSTFPGKKTLLPQNLMPMVSRRLMSTKEAMRFGKVFKDYMAKRDMKDARHLQQPSHRLLQDMAS